MSSLNPIQFQVLLFLVAMLQYVAANTHQETRSSRVLPRHQRQIITDELGIGLTGTGTSFQSFYGGYNNYDTLNGQQQVLTGAYDYDQLGKNGYNSRPLLPTNTGLGIGGGADGYIGGGGYLPANGVGQNWRGFGRGRYPNRGKLGGVKY